GDVTSADDFAKFLNLNTTQEAIHVGCTAYSSTNTTVFTSLTEDEFSSVKPWFTTLIDNYKVLIYSGQLDIIVATTLTENFLQSLEWKHSKEYSMANRLVWKLDKGDTEVTGYVKRVANFTEKITDQCFESQRVLMHFIIGDTIYLRCHIIGFDVILSALIGIANDILSHVVFSRVVGLLMSL
ncbi:unnamed protein product, partial [Medioppia subpectinata]